MREAIREVMPLMSLIWVVTSPFRFDWRDVRSEYIVLKVVQSVFPSEATVCLSEVLVGSVERVLQSLKKVVIFAERFELSSLKTLCTCVRYCS